MHRMNINREDRLKTFECEKKNSTFVSGPRFCEATGLLGLKLRNTIEERTNLPNKTIYQAYAL